MRRLPTSGPPQARKEPTNQIPWSTDPPISRLPNEILGTIFRLLLPSDSSLRVEILGTDPPEQPSPPRTPCQWQAAVEAPSWTDILYVCKRWRTFALGYPALWTQLTHNPAWTNACIRRSRQMPLELCIDQTQPNLPGAIKALQIALPHFSRMTDVKIIAAQHNFVAMVFQCFDGRPAPRLEALSLACSGCSGSEFVNAGANHWLQCTDTLFAQHTPRLRLLDVALTCRVQLPPSAPLFRSLTHVALRHPTLWKDEPMAAFAACVATWTRLETLVLIGALPHEPVVAPASPYPLHAPDLAHRIVLPRLRQIRISTDAATAVDQFLRYFVLPPHVSLYLDCELYDSPEIDSWGPREVAPTVVALSLLENVPAPAMRRVTDVFVFLNAHLLEVAGRVRPRDEEDMEDDDSDESNIDVDDDLENEVGHFSDPDGPLGTQLHVVLREPEDDDSDSDSDSDVAGPANTAAPLDLGAILAQLSLTHTTYIELNIDRALPRETWLRALAPMRRLEDLHFLSNGPEADSASLLAGFLDAFAGDGPDGEHDLGRDTEADWRSLLLPRLRLLSFPAANFSGAMWRRLGAALRRRREAGAQMQMLVVEECAGEEGVHRPDGRTLEELEELLEERVFWRTRKMVGSDCQSSEEGESEEEEVEDEGEEEEEEEEL